MITTAVLALGLALLASAGGTPGAYLQPDLGRGGKIHVAAIQITGFPGGLAENQENVERLAREAAGRGARYILLPEYYPGQLANKPGMTVEQVRAGAQDLNGAIARHMLGLCKELNIWIAFPLAERRADGNVYNSTVYAGPDGIEGVYSKTVLINVYKVARKKDGQASEPPKEKRVLQEDEIFTRGTTDGVITWGGVRVGALICADGGFPNLYQMRAKKGVQMFCHASGSAGIKTGENNPMPDVAARRYSRPVIFANHWVDTFLHQGNTQICDAEGNVLAHVGRKPNVVIDAVITLPPAPEAESQH